MRMMVTMLTVLMCGIVMLVTVPVDPSTRSSTAHYPRCIRAHAHLRGRIVQRRGRVTMAMHCRYRQCIGTLHSSAPYVDVGETATDCSYVVVARFTGDCEAW